MDGPKLLVGLAVSFAVLELASGWIEPYGLFHDELYYWACARRLGFGYVDHPPLAPWVLSGVIAILGDGRIAFGLVPALCGAGTILLAGRIARLLGSGAFGQVLAGLCVAVIPINLVMFSFYSVNALEVLLWTTTTFLFVDLIRTGDERRWIAIGAIAGIGLLNKHTFALLGFGIFAGVIATPLRTQLRSRWLWLGVVVALVLALPNLVWNAQHGWPSLAFYASRPSVDLPASVLDALEIQILTVNPANLLVWAPGIFFLLSGRKARAYAPLAIAFLVLFAVILLSGAKRADRIVGIYPVVLAAGGAFWDQWRGRGQAAVRIVLPTAVLGFGILVVPGSLPLMSPEAVGRYFEALGESPEIETSDAGQPIPIYLMGRLEWKRFAAQVTRAWEELPRARRDRAAVLAPHWLYASVVEYYGRDRGVKPVVAPHNGYWFWREEAEGRDVVLAVAIPEGVLSHYFGSTREVAIFRCDYCTTYRLDIPIVLGTDPVRPLEELLTDWRHFSIQPSPHLRRVPTAQ